MLAVSQQSQLQLQRGRGAGVGVRGGMVEYDAPPIPGLRFPPPASKHTQWPFGLDSFTA